MSLKNARVLVIGGTSGIGLGVASAAAERGAIPIVVSRRQSSVDRALAGLPDQARGAAVDLTDPASLDRLADDIGDIDHLVFTAGESLELAPLTDLTPDVVNRFFHTRFVGALNALTKALAFELAPIGAVTPISTPGSRFDQIHSRRVEIADGCEGSVSGRATCSRRTTQRSESVRRSWPNSGRHRPHGFADWVCRDGAAAEAGPAPVG
jgi:NAD(P)-dependent dehydrogenase (short-subunit alcohol dehydrogenase family)